MVAVECGLYFSMAFDKAKWARDDRAKNPEKYRQRVRDARKNQKPETLKKIRESEKAYKKKWLANPVNRLAHSLRTRIGKFIRGTNSATKELGCSVVELKLYLEARFAPGMTWENYGDWHVDHIIPLSKFDLTDIVQFKQACHYTNLQPLWATDNIRKRNK